MILSSQSRADLRVPRFLPEASDVAVRTGFRFGNRGTHSSRTMMFAELTAVLAATSPQSNRKDYADAIIGGNCLVKPTASTRRLSNQRLGELYALDPSCAIFRVLRRLWPHDEAARPLLALLGALARDPLLMATSQYVVSLPLGSELQRIPMRDALRAVVGERFNDAILGKIIRNAASSWTQAGHLEGRTFKIRRRVDATPTSVAFALYLAHASGFRGEELLTSGWVLALDCSPALGRSLALEAKRIGLIDVRAAGSVFELGLHRLDPGPARS